MSSKAVQRNYLILTLLNTLAASFIWGINTLFLLDAGLSNTEAFAANAFFTLGMMMFEVPTGVVADTFGRRASFLAGSFTLFLGTLVYYYLWHIQFAFWGWALISMFLGLGFTFFTGAVEAWLVDALNATGFNGRLEDVFSKGQIVSGVAMLSGSVVGGFVAQATDLGMPFLLRSAVLILSFTIAALLMRDLGFTARKSQKISAEMSRIMKASINSGLRVPAVRWAMLVTPFLSGVGIYGFYAAQPYLLDLYGDSKAYGVAGIMAALVASAQIFGGLIAPRLVRLFRRRSTIIFVMLLAGLLLLMGVGWVKSFWPAVILIGLWGLVGAIMIPVRQAYLNHCIKSDERATILSFDGLLGSTGGVVLQPALGRSADMWGYPVSFIISGLIQVIALPLVLLMRREDSPADHIESLSEEKS